MSCPGTWDSGGNEDAVLSAVERRVGVKRRTDSGSALVVALLTMTLMGALGGALLLTTMTEARIGAGYRDGVETFYAAEGALELAVQELGSAPDWDALLSGAVTSGLVDGPASGERTLPGGETLDLTELTNQVRCGRATTCSDADLVASRADRVWGANNPRWQLFVYGRFGEMVSPGTDRVRTYVIVWVADDPSEDDDNARRDATVVTSPGRGRVELLAHAYGPSGARRVIVATVARTGVDAEGRQRVRVLSWREFR